MLVGRALLVLARHAQDAAQTRSAGCERSPRCRRRSASRQRAPAPAPPLSPTAVPPPPTPPRRPASPALLPTAPAVATPGCLRPCRRSSLPAPDVPGAPTARASRGSDPGGVTGTVGPLPDAEVPRPRRALPELPEPPDPTVPLEGVLDLSAAPACGSRTGQRPRRCAVGARRGPGAVARRAGRARRLPSRRRPRPPGCAGAPDRRAGIASPVSGRRVDAPDPRGSGGLPASWRRRRVSPGRAARRGARLRVRLGMRPAPSA
jgi:hypothetical protein